MAYSVRITSEDTVFVVTYTDRDMTDHAAIFFSKKEANVFANALFETGIATPIHTHLSTRCKVEEEGKVVALN